MHHAETIARAIDRLNEWIGRAVSLLTIGTVLITFAVAVLRYVFNMGWVWMQESYLWMNAFVVLAASGYTLLHDAHVRCDFLYGAAGPVGKAWIDLLGTIFLLFPTCALVAWTSLGYVATAWGRMEGSAQAGGLPGLYLLKTMILVFCALLFLQGVATALRCAVRIADHRTARRARTRGDAPTASIPLPHRAERSA